MDQVHLKKRWICQTCTHESPLNVHKYLPSPHASTDRKKSDKIYHLNISRSVVVLLRMAPMAAGVSGLRNFTPSGKQALERETAGSPPLHFYAAVWLWLIIKIHKETKTCGGPLEMDLWVMTTGKNDVVRLKLTCWVISSCSCGGIITSCLILCVSSSSVEMLLLWSYYWPLPNKLSQAPTAGDSDLKSKKLRSSLISNKAANCRILTEIWILLFVQIAHLRLCSRYCGYLLLWLFIIQIIDCTIEGFFYSFTWNQFWLCKMCLNQARISTFGLIKELAGQFETQLLVDMDGCTDAGRWCTSVRTLC